MRPKSLQRRLGIALRIIVAGLVAGELVEYKSAVSSWLRRDKS